MRLDKVSTIKRFFTRKPESSPPDDPPQATQSCIAIQERSDMYLRTITVLFDLLKAFTLNIQEIQSDRFKSEVEALTQRFQELEKPKHLEVHFENQADKMKTYIDRQRAYLEDREIELRDIIDLLTRALAHLNVENREFYERINNQGEKIIALSGLDDIKKIKIALKAEVDQMRQIVYTKQDQEQRRIQLLSGQVQTLQGELEKARHQSLTDGLTGIYNRLALDDVLAERIAHATAHGHDFCLLMIDVDDFKPINDNHGHGIGDRVLIALAQKFRNSVRNEDFVCRYGGEEFTILLDGAAYRNGIKKAEQIRSTIASVRYATSEAQTGDYLSVTISIGVSQFRKGDTADDLITRADKALYEAKRKGKNCVVGKKS
jgi:diguanylate cyclase